MEEWAKLERLGTEKDPYYRFPKQTYCDGLELIVVCQHGNGEQKRKHRKRRINKKWLKRYGVWSGQPLNAGQMMLAFDKLLLTRTDFFRLKSALRDQIQVR